MNLKVVTDFLAIQRQETVVVAAATVVVLGLYFVSTKVLGSKKPKHKPWLVPDTTLPVLGNLLDLGKQQHRMHDWMADVSQQFNNQPWVFNIPGRSSTFVVSSPEHFEEILKTQWEIFLRGEEGQYISDDFLGSGVVITDGDEWYSHRKAASSLFNMQKMREGMEETVRSKASILCDLINKQLAKDEPVSMKRALAYFTMDVFGKIGFGVDLNNLQSYGTDTFGSEFEQAFTNLSVAFGQRIQTPIWLWRLKRFLNVGWEKILRENLNILNKFCSKVITESMARKHEEAKTGKESQSNDLISMFLEGKFTQHIRDVMGYADEAKILRDMVVSFILAGKDSTAHGMGWFIVNMNRHPHVLKKIREEIQEKLPGLFTGEIDVPTAAQISTLTYLEAAVRENTRLFPSTAFLVREAIQDTTLADGTFVKKGMTVMLVSWASGRNKNAWGEDAAEYKPERWIDETTGKLKIVSGSKFNSFGFGPHVCIGMQFALMEMKTTLGTLFSKFDLKTREDPWKMTYDFSLTTPVSGPILCDITPYKHQVSA